MDHASRKPRRGATSMATKPTMLPRTLVVPCMSDHSTCCSSLNSSLVPKCVTSSVPWSPKKSDYAGAPVPPLDPQRIPGPLAHRHSGTAPGAASWLACRLHLAPRTQRRVAASCCSHIVWAGAGAAAARRGAARGATPPRARCVDQAQARGPPAWRVRRAARGGHPKRQQAQISPAGYPSGPPIYGACGRGGARARRRPPPTPRAPLTPPTQTDRLHVRLRAPRGGRGGRLAPRQHAGAAWPPKTKCSVIK